MPLRFKLHHPVLLLLLLIGWACNTEDSAAQVRNARPGPRATLVGTIKEDRIKEASGIAASRKHAGIYWTHNDGNDGVLFAIRRDGSLVGSASIDAKVRDWEDIAIDDGGNLYIADTGNNSENRKHVVIYRVREPDPAALTERGAKRIAVEETWKVDFPDDPSNIESLIIRQDVGYFIFKVPEGIPADVYRFDLKGEKKASMTKAFTLPIERPVTAADLSRDGKQLAVLTRGDLWVFDIDGDITRAPTAPVTRFPVPPVQTEGCCFADGEILIVSESREVFAAPLGLPATQPVQP